VSIDFKQITAASAPDRAGLRVLVVEDNQDAAFLLGELLSACGHQVKLAHTGDEAISVADSYAPEVVFLDIGLPDLDGRDVAVRMRERATNEPVIAALTGWTADRTRSDAGGGAERAVDFHIVKPASFEALQAVLAFASGREADDRTSTDAAPEGEESTASHPNTARRVLVVDDDDDIRAGLAEFLEDHGFEVVTARDGRDALDKLTGADVCPCVIILDLMMPNMNGKQFREEQLCHPRLADIPVVLISAHADVAGTRRDVPGAAFLPKPLDMTALLQMVRAHSAPSA
jgi:DNA-binding response OmpR family regulator